MKVGDKIYHKTKECLGHKFNGTIIQSNFHIDSTYQILWDKQMWNTGPYETWVLSDEIVLDIEQLRHRKLTELGIEL